MHAAAVAVVVVVRRVRSSLAGVAALAGVLVCAWVTIATLAAQQATPPPQDDTIPHGTVTKYTWTTSKVYPGTTRDYWVYVPAQYDGSTPACVMVFQDGSGYVDPKGAWHVPQVFDTLIQRKEMPVTIGIFINPGIVPATSADALNRYNRSFEYDAVGDRYAQFLLTEILPEVGKQYRLAPDGNSRAIGGASSGAIAAFTVAWEHPEAFGRVLSTIGTYVGFRGGHEYPFLIRKTEPKPLRVFLEDGTADNNNYGGDWYLANQTMLSALTFAGYEVEHHWAEGGGHESKHGAPILADMLKWLWHDYPTPVAVGVGSKQPVMEVLLPNESWQPAATAAGLKIGSGPATNAEGDLFFVDEASHRIEKLPHDASADAAPQVFAERADGIGRLAIGADGRLYAADPVRRHIVSYDASGKLSVVATGVTAHDITVGATGRVYATDAATHQVLLVSSNNSSGGNASGTNGTNTTTGSHTSKRVVAEMGAPRGVQLTPDQTLLYVSDARERMVYSFQVQPDGSLAHKEPFCHLQVPVTEVESGADGMTVDTLGRLFIATPLGVQFCDQIGRVNGIINAPSAGGTSGAAGTLTDVTFGGHSLDTLYAVSADHLFRRKTKATGVLSFQKPIKPPIPRL